ncbi:MAG: amino acid ABC transporter permease, partial [Clostridia bacterium]|nr:amino acid ABC transporter permease [Clostridia bacterium]
SVMRGTPLMLQLFVVYYLPYFAFKIPLSVFGDNYMLLSVVLAFVLNYAAYFAEIYRSGISSIPQGQYEAAKVLGLSKGQTFLHVILAQVVRRVLPALTNEIITLVKDTSLAFAVGLIEMFTKAKQIAAAEVSMVPYFVAGLLYYVFNFAVAMVMEQAEKRFGRYAIR